MWEGGDNREISHLGENKNISLASGFFLMAALWNVRISACEDGLVGREWVMWSKVHDTFIYQMAIQFATWISALCVFLITSAETSSKNRAQKSVQYILQIVCTKR